MNNENLELAAFANGCYWCSEAVFQKLAGVYEVLPGFMGGNIKNPCYREVVTGRTGHAESVALKYDPKKISYKELLFVFFATHDPTTIDRQGNDVGSHYRSVIFYYSEEQKKVAEEVIEKLNEEIFCGKIVSKIQQATEFYQTESEHINFYETHREFPYCQLIIDPKIQKLRKEFSDKLIS